MNNPLARRRRETKAGWIGTVARLTLGKNWLERKLFKPSVKMVMMMMATW